MEMSITPADVRASLALLRQDFPGLRLRATTGTRTRALTIGHWIWLPHTWETLTPARQYAILRHEAVHVAQYTRLGMGNAWLGVLPFLLCYLLLPVPVGFAWFRWRWEREAFQAQMQAEVLASGAEGLLARRAYYVALFTGKGAYFWAWPWRGAVERWIDAAMALAIYQVRTQEGTHGGCSV